MTIIVIGSIAFYRIAVFADKFKNHIIPDKIHQLNVSFAVDDMTVNFGGTGANIAYTLGLLGTNPKLLGTIGEDAEEFKAHLQSLEVNCDHLHLVKDELTSNATIMTDLDDNQITSFYMGAMKQMDELSVSEAGNADLVIIAPNLVEAMVKHSNECKEKGIKYIADPGQALPLFNKEQLTSFIDGAEVLTVNDYEYQLILDRTELVHEQVMNKVKYLIITYGEKGSKLWSSDDMTQIPVYKANEVVDPTGCGDAYRAGLIYGLSMGLDMEKSAHIGSWVASIAVTKKGTQNHKIDKMELDNFIKTI